MAVLPNQDVSLIKPRNIKRHHLSNEERDYGLTWGLKALEVKEIWEETQGKGIHVAILDTGVWASHPALKGRVERFAVIDPLGRKLDNKAMTPFDVDSHGTHVCGTIAGGTTKGGVAIGVAPAAKLIVAATLFESTTVLRIIKAIEWAVQEGADIINMSFGVKYQDELLTTILEPVCKQWGVLPVAAIGNEYFGSSSAPGNLPVVLGVGAIEKQRDKYRVVSFSSGASLLLDNGEYVDKPDVVAPGYDVYSSVPAPPTGRDENLYDYYSGTSMAAPHVSGAAALMMSACPHATPTDIFNSLLATAESRASNSAQRDNRWGEGRIQPRKALDNLKKTLREREGS